MKQIKNLLQNFLNFFKTKSSYSQWGEDMLLYSFYENKKNYKGFYIDIGAHHPVRFSNTYFFYKKGWRGINIDATPGSMTSFKVVRPRDVNIECAISETEQCTTFYLFNEPALNTFSKELAEERQSDKYYIKNKISIVTKPLSAILSMYLPLNQTIDFMSVDCEGVDLQVLKSNDWKKYRPNYIAVEDIDFNLKTYFNSDIYQYLTSLNYNLISFSKYTTIYKDLNCNN